MQIREMDEFPASKCISEDFCSYYTVLERLHTFKDSHWPFERGPCTPLKVRACKSSFDSCCHPMVKCLLKTDVVLDCT